MSKPKTEEHKQKLSKVRMGKYLGEKGSNWRGGVSSLEHLIRTNIKSRQWRDDILTRDEFTCQKCGKVGGKLHAHHIIRFASILQKYEITTLEEALECDELWSLNNGVTFCKECHKGMYRKEKIK